MASPRTNTSATLAASAVAPRTVVDHLAVMDMDLDEMAEAQKAGNTYKLSVLDLDTKALLHPSDGLRPGDEGFSAVIVHHHPNRAYYGGRAYDEDKVSPPDCVSWDAAVGYGSPGGACAQCPLSAFGEDCHPLYTVYGLTIDGFLPVRLTIPRTSVRSVRRFLSRAPYEYGKPLTSIVVTIKAVKRERGQGNMLVFSRGADLSKEAAAAVRSYASGFRAILDFPQLGGSGAPQLEDPTMNRQQIAAGSGALPSASTRVKAEDDEEDDDLPF